MAIQAPYVLLPFPPTPDYLIDAKVNVLSSALQVNSVALTNCERFIASGSDDTAVRMWDLASHTAYNLEGHAGFVWHVSFSADDALLASSSADESARVWDWKKRT